MKITSNVSDLVISKQNVRSIANSIATTVKAKSFIPVDMINGITKRGAIGGVASIRDAGSGKSDGGKTGSKEHLQERVQMDKVKDRLASYLFDVPVTYYIYYEALLNAINDVLADPQQKAQGVRKYRDKVFTTVQANRAVFLNLKKMKRLRYTRGYGPNTRIVLTSGVTRDVNWYRLSKDTMKKKRAIGSTTFWKHSGELSRAFAAARLAQLANLSEKDFIRGEPTVRLQGVSDDIGFIGRTVKKQNCYAAQISLQVIVPKWKGPAVMDKIITYPFMGSMIDSYISPAEGKLNQSARGLDKLPYLEQRRPWLRRLSYLVGEEMRNTLKQLGK